ncbi:lanthionine synthetase-like protein [Chitinophaga skermanii]|uniref:Lanthionine synthetase-like protein n=1 Tax=Chitinophaga skermanii TaxID=331697 RepID=A0A327QVH1_9BACT|nr:lanthionine synthetase LanC family protein [Chitinophaga skermanii]RAJ08609.1 lanthionine synthetase-like protein [Chitinophaga skermanii]
MNATTQQLKGIYEDMVHMFEQKKFNTEYSTSLFKGPWGALLYMFYYEQYIDPTQDRASEVLEELYTNFNPGEGTDFSFCNGHTGPFWLLHHLNKYEFIEIDIQEIMPGFIEAAIEYSKAHIANKNFDFLHGSVGICNFLVDYANEPHVKAHLADFVTALQKIAFETPQGLSVPMFYMTEPFVEGGVNSFSLAHGNCAVQILLAKIYQKGIAQDACTAIVSGNIEYMINNRNQVADNAAVPLYPAIMDGQSVYSRLSWCYGDLNVAIALLICGKTWANDEWLAEAHHIMQHNMQRDTMELAGILDNCICHGSSGIAAFYRRFWHETRHQSYLDCAAQWHEKAIDFMKFDNDGSAHGIKVWLGRDREWDYCWDLLDGSCGVGLSLLSHTQAEPLPWDEFLLLS